MHRRVAAELFEAEIQQLSKCDRQAEMTGLLHFKQSCKLFDGWPAGGADAVTRRWGESGTCQTGHSGHRADMPLSAIRAPERAALAAIMPIENVPDAPPLSPHVNPPVSPPATGGVCHGGRPGRVPLAAVRPAAAWLVFMLALIAIFVPAAAKTAATAAGDEPASGAGDAVDPATLVLDGRFGEHDADQMMHAFLIDAVARRSAARRDEVAGLAGPEALQQWQKSMRAWFIDAVGGLPPDDTPLNAVVTGEASRPGYRVEKILLESQPGHHVTANLFLPYSPGFEPPYAAVLVACGHSATGKGAEIYQRGAALFAVNGIAALMFDPIDQGERHQLRRDDGQPVAQGTRAHNLLGIGSMLLGNNTAQFMIHDARRCLDYLQSRDDIDPDRIGMAGNSGGGTQTSLVMGIEPRIKAAAPSCYITAFEEWFGYIRERGDVPADAEQCIAGQIEAGLDHWGFLLMTAPRPVLVCAAEQDFFPIAGTRRAIEFTTPLFERMDATNRLALVVDPGTHGWQTSLREASVEWMLYWLNGERRDVTEPDDLELLTDEEIQVTETGAVLDLDGARSTYDINADRMARLREGRESLWGGDLAATLDEVRRVTGIRPLDQLPEPRVERLEPVPRDGHALHPMRIEAEEGIVLPAVALVPGDGNGEVVLWLDARGKSDPAVLADPLVGRHLEAGRTVLAVDLRGLGETQSPPNPWYGIESAYHVVAYLLDRSYVAMRAEDVLSALVAARQLAGGDAGEPVVHLVARGAEAAVPTLHAAALERSRFASVDIDGGPGSYEEVVANPVQGPGHLANVVHAALTAYDLPDLRRVIEGAGR